MSRYEDGAASSCDKSPRSGGAWVSTPDGARFHALSLVWPPRLGTTLVRARWSSPVTQHVRPALLLGLSIAVVALVVAAIATRAVGERNLLANGGFDSSLDGWSSWNARLLRQARGDAGRGSALVTWSGASRSYAVYTSPRPVSRLRSGMTFVATAALRSRSRPGQRVCLILREWTPAGALVAASWSCRRSSARWRRFAPVSHAVRRQGGQLEVVLVGGDPRPGDSFVVDDVDLAASDRKTRAGP